MKSNFTRFLTLALALIMVLSMVPAAFAAEADVALPTATVMPLEVADYTVAMTFIANELTEEQLAEYSDWGADFVMTVNKDVTFGEGNYLGGQYKAWSNDWVVVPGTFSADANEEIHIIEKIASLNGGNDTVNLGYVYDTVKEFNCGAYFTPAFLQANPDLVVTLKLVITDGTTTKTIGDVLTFEPEFKVPAAPTASAAKVQSEDLTFAMQFVANKPTADQMAYYGNWEADFVLSVNKAMNLNANGKKDGYLAGQYDAWSADWVNVPMGEDVELTKDQELNILEYAQTAMGNTEFKGVTYREVVEKVKEFNCGLYVSPEFLAANRDLTATLKLVITNGDEQLIIGTYSFSAATPALPTATVKEITAADTTFAMQFTAVQPSEEQLAYFGGWYADYVMIVNKPMTLNENGEADGYLAGQYDAWSDNWVKLPYEDLALTSGQSVQILQYNASNMGSNAKLTYAEVLEIGTFNCGLYLTPEYLKNNAGLEVKLQLRLYNPAYESEYYVIGETYSFKETQVTVNGEVANGSVAEILDETDSGTVELVKDAATNEAVTVVENVTLDLAGSALTTSNYLTVHKGGALVDNSADKSGLLVVDKEKLILPKNNPQLPVYTGEGYKFFTITKLNVKEVTEGEKFVFQPLFEAAAREYLLKGRTTSGVKMQVKVSWFDAANGTEVEQYFTYTDALVKQYLESYNAETGKYGKVFTLVLNNTNGIEDLTFTAVISNAGVEMSA